MQNYYERALELNQEMIENRRYLHQHPEIGMDLKNTTDYVEERLREMGYEPKRAGGGITACAGKEGGKVFLLRADMDALPLQEESGLPFASVNAGKAHCCGHDNHTAMLLGAARLLKEQESLLPGTVKFMFQPAEETLEGARAMIADGILKNPDVDAAFALHVNSQLPCGLLRIGSGPVCPSSDKITITIKGHGSHASRPHESVDPIHVAAMIHTGLMELHAREIPQGEYVVLSIGAIHAGQASNIIPETAVMNGSLRTYSSETRTWIKERIQTIAGKMAEAFRAEAVVEYSPNFAVSLIADENVAAQVLSSATEVLGEGKAQIMKNKYSGSEDFAFVAEQVPATMAILGAAVPGYEKWGQHNPKVRFNEDCLAKGAAIYAQTAHQWLENHQ